MNPLETIICLVTHICAGIFALKVSCKIKMALFPVLLIKNT